ncbi:MAG: glycosyltransferase [Candidatus Krumholzibacteriia bacterium]
MTVVIATYNQGRYVGMAIRSILDQDYPCLELIVVDDGSTDETPAVLEEFVDDPRVRILRQPNQGQTIAKNRGCREARGKYLGFCDGDDFWLPGKLGTQVPIMEADEGIAVVYGESRWIDSEGREVPTYRAKRYSGQITAQLLIENFITFPTVLVRRSAFEDLGGFDERLTMSIDYDLWLRMSVAHGFRYIPQVFACYRIWDGQMSARVEERLRNAMALLERFHEANPDAVSGMVRRRARAYTLTTRGLWLARSGRSREAYRDLLRAVILWPASKRTWKGLTKLGLRRV